MSKVDGDEEEQREGESVVVTQSDVQQDKDDSVEQPELKEAVNEEPTHEEELEEKKQEVEGQPSTRQSDNDAVEKPASETAEEGKQGISEETHEDNVEEQQASTAVAAPTRAETKRVDHTFKLINTLSDINEEIEEIKARVKDTGNVQEKINMMNRLGCCCQERMINNKELTVSTRRPDCKQQARPNPMTLSHR